MKKLIVIVTALLVGCAGTSVVTKDVCEEFRTSIPDNKTVIVRTDGEFNDYMYGLGATVAYKKAHGLTPCATINAHLSWMNQTLKGEYCMVEKTDGWYLCENVCEYTQDEVTHKSLDYCNKLGL
jgi:hypothetical protein